LEALTGQPCATRGFERIGPRGKSAQAPYPHLDLARPLDLFIVAPATANTLYKLAHGAADDLLPAATARLTTFDRLLDRVRTSGPPKRG
jgi:phosphopantothenoylcysteine synthetase/decarboxylase